MGGSARTIAMVAVAVVAAVAAPYLEPFIAEGLGTLIVGEEAAVLGVEGVTAVELTEGGFIAADAAATATADAIAASEGGFMAADAAASAAASTAANIETAAQIASGAVTGAGSGAIQAELAGTDPWEGAFQGALAGGVGSAVSGAVGGLLPDGTPAPVKAGVKGAATGFTSAELRGKDLQTALTTGAISGLASAGTSALFPEGFLGTQAQTDAAGNPIEGAPEVPQYRALETALKTVGGSYLKQNISNIFNPTPTTGLGSTTTSSGSTSKVPGTTSGSSTSVAYTPSGQSYTPSSSSKSSSSGSSSGGGYSGGGGDGSSSSSGGGGSGGVQTSASPGSQALSQALGVGAPSLGTSGTALDTSTAGETPDPSTGGTPQNVWNMASLRVKDDIGDYL
jgi:hypothetical protein